jgi:hypothetical protein
MIKQVLCLVTNKACVRSLDVTNLWNGENNNSYTIEVDLLGCEEDTTSLHSPEERDLDLQRRGNLKSRNNSSYIAEKKGEACNANGRNDVVMVFLFPTLYTNDIAFFRCGLSCTIPLNIPDYIAM